VSKIDIQKKRPLGFPAAVTLTPNIMF